MVGFTRRSLLTATAVGTAVLAGCNESSDGQTPTERETPTETLVVPTETTTTVTATPTASATPTVTRTPTPNPNGTATPTSTPSSPPPSSGGGGGGGSPPTETETPTATPAQELVIPAGDSHTESGGPVYTGVEWHDTGQLVIEDGAGFQLTDQGADQ